MNILETLSRAKSLLVDKFYTPSNEILGKECLKNAVILMEKGYPLTTDVDKMLVKHKILDDAPDYKAPAKKPKTSSEDKRTAQPA